MVVLCGLLQDSELLGVVLIAYADPGGEILSFSCRAATAEAPQTGKTEYKLRQQDITEQLSCPVGVLFCQMFS